jgi:hypothetical protein
MTWRPSGLRSSVALPSIDAYIADHEHRNHPAAQIGCIMKIAHNEPAAEPQKEQPVPTKGLQEIRTIHDILETAIAVWLEAHNEQLWNAARR